MAKYHARFVAAAIMLEQSGPWDYKQLATEVVDSELSTLGLKGKTPEQTMGSILRRYRDIFKSYDYRQGLYVLRDSSAAERIPEVQEIRNCLRNANRH